MLSFFKNAGKKNRIRMQIEKMQAKAQLMQAKIAIETIKSKRELGFLTKAKSQIEASDELKKYVAESTEANVILQILNNEGVQQLLKTVGMKLLSGGKVSANDDELITLYKELPHDIKAKVKEFAMDYVGGIKK